MRKVVVTILALVLAPQAIGRAQQTPMTGRKLTYFWREEPKPVKTAMIITAEQVQAVLKSPGGDHQIAVVDVGHFNLLVGARRAGKGQTPSPQQGPSAYPTLPCGQQSGTLSGASGIAHDEETETYIIIAGTATLVTGGAIIKGNQSPPESEATRVLNGPSCGGPIGGDGVEKRRVKPGDVVVLPPNTPHGWQDVADTLDYILVRQDPDRSLPAGYIHPAIAKDFGRTVEANPAYQTPMTGRKLTYFWREEAKPVKAAVIITAEQIQTVLKSPGGDHQAAIVDVGKFNLLVGARRSGRGQTASESQPQAQPQPQPQGRGSAYPTLPCGQPTGALSGASGIAHDEETETYVIIAGTATLVTGGAIIKGNQSSPESEPTRVLNGPSCGGSIGGEGVEKRKVKPGDVVILPPNTPHGWQNVEGTLDYILVRQDPDHALPAGYIHPSIAKEFGR